MLHVKSAADFTEAGEMRQIELCTGDLIQFNVNMRDKKIYNGNIARITDDPHKVMLLYPDGKPRQLIELPEEYATYKYGWVTTSHKSQGRTSETVVVAAQALDRKAFYVALSRGRKHMALHCPEKEFLKQQLSFRIGDRKSVHDLARDGQILPLSEDAMTRKAETLPDTKYKSLIERTRAFMKSIKRMADNLLGISRKISARRARNRKYGYGIVTSEVKLEIEKQNALAVLEEERRKAERAERIHRKLHPPKELSPYEEAMLAVKAMEERRKQREAEQTATPEPKEEKIPPIPVPQEREAVSVASVSPRSVWHYVPPPKLLTREEALLKMERDKERLAEIRAAREQKRLAQEQAAKEQAAREQQERAEAERLKVEAVQMEQESHQESPEVSKPKKKPSRGMDI